MNSANKKQNKTIHSYLYKSVTVLFGILFLYSFFTHAPQVNAYSVRVVFLTSGSTWEVPSDWNSSNNTIEVIGAGGGGASGNIGSGGAGGGAYSKISNLSLTPGEFVSYQVGVGGVANATGTDTLFNGIGTTCATNGGDVCAKGGGAGSTTIGGQGASSTLGIGTVRTAGGNGNTGNGATTGGGGGGGGAGGPHSNGAAAGTAGGSGGGGGGAADGGSSGSNGSLGTGGAGGNNRNSEGSGAAGNPPVAGALGAGGGGSSGGGTNGGAGGTGEILWTSDASASTAGPGGGGAGGTGSTGVLAGSGGAGGRYGGGGGGGGATTGGTDGVGGTGGNGIIVITYTVSATSGTDVYSATTTTQTFIVPIGVSSITVKAWGAGGGGGRGAVTGRIGGAGGGGGFSQATIPVTPGQMLTIHVGDGGGGAVTSGYPGPGAGYSGVFLGTATGTNAMIIAGGGGGGGGAETAGTAAIGGAGGGSTGGAGGNGSATYGGQGGTQSAGGAKAASGLSNGSSLQGGNGGPSSGGRDFGVGLDGGLPGGGASGGDNSHGGGAGGGYYGGGGGGGTGLALGGGGGGGSNYVSYSGSSATTSTQANGSTTANTSDTDYIGGVGMGGAGGNNYNGIEGGDGLVVISYEFAQESVTYSNDTSGTTFVVPSGVTAITVKTWGAGGGGGRGFAANGVGGAGGGGGFSQSTITVTPGESLTVRVGGGGESGASSGQQSGAGGGYSGVFRSSTALIMAGAGGGGGAGASTAAIDGGAGGGGGGTTGANGVSAPTFSNGGSGGTQSAGGAGGTGTASSDGEAGEVDGRYEGGDGLGAAGGPAGGTNGGGDASTYLGAGGSGGGAGYYGGGGSEGNVGENIGTGGAGGGSNYVSGSATTSTQASGSTTPNRTDDDYLGSSGMGGAGGQTSASNGNDGLVVISYNTAAVSQVFLVSGTVYNDNGITPVGSNVEVNLKVDGYATTTAITATDGTYNISSGTSSPSTPMTLYINGSSTLKATTFLMGVDGVSDVTGIPLYNDTFISMSTTSAGTVDLKKMTFFDMEDDGDVLYSAYGSSTLATSSPATTTIYGNFLVATGTTYAPAALAVKGDFTNNGTFKHSGGVVDISGKPYSLGGFSATTTALFSSFSIAGQEGTADGVVFNTDGTRMFVIGFSGNVYEYHLSTPYAVTTATFDSSFSVASQETGAHGVTFSPDGTNMYVVGQTNDTVYQYYLGIAFTISTARYASSSKSVATEDTAPTDVSFNPDGTKMFITGSTGSDINEYHLSTPWNVSTAVFASLFSVASQGTVPKGHSFNTDGTKMFVIAFGGLKISEYLLSTPFDISTAVFGSYFSVADEATPQGLSFNIDGTKMFTIGSTGDKVYEYHLLAPYDLAATTTGSFSVSAQDTSPHALAFNPDGTKMFVTGQAGVDVYEYILSTGFDVSTASFRASTSVSAQDTIPTGIAFNPDGTKMFVVGNTDNEVNEYNLSVGFDITTAIFDSALDVTAQDSLPRDIAFNPDGTKMFVVGGTGSDINEYTLSTGFDVSTAVFVDSFLASGEDGTPFGIAFSNDGTKMFVTGKTGDEVNVYYLSTGFDVSTAVYAHTLSVAAQDSEPGGIRFNTDGTKMYVVGFANDRVHQYDLPEIFITGSSTIGGTLTGTSTFNDLRLSGNSQKTFSANASTSNLTIAEAGTLVSAPAKLSINGNFANNGTFAHNNGSVYLSGTSSAISGHFVGSTTALYDTVIDTGLIYKNDGVTWNAQAETQPNGWRSVAYGSSTYVAVSSDGTNRVMTSPDGITWSPQNAAEANSWISVTYGEGLFVAVAYSGTNRIMTSPDGVTWTARAAPEANLWNGVTYGNGQFVAVSNDGTNRVMTSPDGISWTARAAAEQNSWNSVVYGEGVFVAVANSGQHRVMTSSDGVTWTKTLASNQVGWLDIAYGNGIFVAVSFTGTTTGRVMTSPDGTGWTARNATEANQWYSVAYGNGLFVAVSFTGTNRVMTSTDGIAWTPQSASEATTWHEVSYGNGKFIAVATTGTDQVMTSTSGTYQNDTVTFADNASTTDLTISANSTLTAPRGLTVSDDYVNNGGFTHGSGTVYFSGADANLSGTMTGTSTFNDVVVDGGGFKNNGVTWTAASSSEQSSWWAVTYGEGLFVAVAAGGTNRVMTSPDGITWTSRPAAEANQWLSVTYANGLFVAVAYTGTNRVMTSPDGITWTARSAAQANGWESVTYGNGKFVAVSSTGSNRVMHSTDGLTWTSATSSEQNTWDAIAYGNGLFVAVSIDGENRVMTSPDGITWTPQRAAAQRHWYGVVYGDGLFVGVASSTGTTTAVMTSPDGVNWTLRAVPQALSWWALTYGNGLFVSASNDGTNRVMTSSDGINWTMRTANEVTQWRSMIYGAGRFVAVGNLGTNRVMYSLSGATTTATLAFSNNASTTDFSISTTETVTAPSQLSVSGDYENNGTFTHNSGTVYFSGTTTAIGGGYDITNSTFMDSTSIHAHETAPTGLAFSSDGTKMFITGIATNDAVYAYNLSKPFSLSTTTFSASTSVATQDTQPEGVAFNNDGTRMFVTGGIGQDINQYTLSTPWDVTTKTFNHAFSVAAQDTAPRNIAFSASGTKMFVTGQTGGDISVYDLATPFTASTSVYRTSLSLASGSRPSGIAFNGDGTILFVLDYDRRDVFAYTLSSAFDVATAATSTNISFLNNFAQLQGLAFSNDGTKMFILDPWGDSINEFDLHYEQTLSGNLTGTSGFNTISFVGDKTKTFLSNASTTGFINASSSIVSPSSRISISGNYTNSGIYSAGLGTTTFNGTGAQILLGSMTSTSTFNNVEFIGAGTKTFSSNASTSNFAIEGGTTVVAPSHLTIGGNYTNNGTFTKGTGTTTFSKVPVSLGGYSLATTTFDASFSVTSQETNPQSIAFSPDGTKMFTVGNINDTVYKYNLSIPFSVSTAVYASNSFSVAGQETYPLGILFNPDGTKMYILGDVGDDVTAYNLSTAWDVSTAVVNGSPFSVATQDTFPVGFAFNANGTKMFVVGQINDSVYEYTLSTGFDIGTAVYSGTFSASTQDATPGSVSFNTDGTKMFVLGTTGDKVSRYTLSTAYDITTAYFHSSTSIATQDTSPASIVFNTSGSKMYMLGYTADTVYEYNMPSPFDFGAVYGSSFSVTTQETSPTGMTFSADGTKMFVLGWARDSVLRYDLSVPFTVSSAKYHSSSTAGETFPEDVVFNPDGTRMFILGSTVPDRIFQYNLAVPYQLSTAMFVASTSITAQETGPSGLTFNPDGTKMFVVGNTGDEVNAYNLSVAYDITTASVNGSPFSVASQDASPEGIIFNPDGTRMFIVGSTGVRAYEYRLTTGFDISTAAFYQQFSLVGIDTAPTDIDFSADRARMYILGFTSDKVTDFNTAESFLSSTTLSGAMTGTNAFNNIAFTDIGTTTFSANASTSNLSNATSSFVYAPSLLSISGNYANAGTYEAGVGTTTFNGTSVQTATGTMTGGSAFYNLEFNNRTATTTLGASTTVDNNFVAVGGATVVFPANASTTVATLTLEGGVGSEIKVRSSIPGTQANLNVGTQKSVNYVNVRDSNACGGTTITALHTTDSGNNTCWTISGDPFMASDADQIFTQGQATTSISTITLTETAAPAILAVNDIRIAIATSTHNMKFDTFDTSAIFGGTAAGKVSGTVSYTGNGSVLIIDVLTNFSALDTLTISGLSFAQFNAIAPVARVLNLYYDGPSDTGVDVTDTQTIAIAGTLAVTNHDSGQATNGFSYQNQTTVPLYRFKMVPTFESSIVGTLTLNLTGVRRITDENLQNISLYRDFNANGVVDGNDEAIAGTGALVTSDQNGTIVFSTSFLATTTQNYIVTGDTVAIKQNEYMTMSLLVSGSVMGSTSLATIVPTGSVLNVRHQRGGGASISGGAGAIGGEAPAGASTTSGGGNSGGESIGGEPGFIAPTAQGTPFNEWTTGANALVSDNIYATAVSADLRQSYSVFGFNVPGGNTVDGIEVKLESSGTTAAGTIQVGLSWDGDTTITAVKATSVLTGSDAVYTLGGPSDTWGRSWTPAELGDANFFVRVVAQPNSNTVRVDAIQVKPYHSATGGGGGGGGEI